MARISYVLTGIFLLALFFTVGFVSAADTDVNLSVSKVVSSAAPYYTGQPITWVVTLANNGPADATNISLAESFSGFTGQVVMSGIADLGTYDNASKTWNISKLDNATSTQLTIVTVFDTQGTQTNNVDILSLDQANLGDTQASAFVNVVTDIPADSANLSVSKVVSSAAPYKTGQPVTWVVTLANNGPADATNISLAESFSGFTGQVTMSGVADLGTYDNTSKIWNISKLDNAASTRLTIVTVFDTNGTQTNNVDILSLDQPNFGNTHANASVNVGNATGSIPPSQPSSVNIVIRPNTLNLNSKGVFTVFVTLKGGDSPFPFDTPSKPRIDITNSSLTCSGAKMISAGFSNKDGGTLIAKFHRQDLENVTSGAGVQINCSGTLSINGKSVYVSGSDTIRVIGEKKGLDKWISGLMKYLGLEKEDIAVNETGDGNVTVSFTLNPDNFKNNGQMQKALKTQDTAPSPTGNVRNISDSQQDTVKNNGKDKNNNGKDNKVQENNAGNNGNKGNQNNNKGNQASSGSSNGKKNKQSNEEGNRD